MLVVRGWSSLEMDIKWSFHICLLIIKIQKCWCTANTDSIVYNVSSVGPSSERKGQCSKSQTILSVLAVHRPFYISICISTLPTQQTTFISVNRDLKEARTATAVNKQLNLTVKNKPHTTNYIYCIFEAYSMIKSV